MGSKGVVRLRDIAMRRDSAADGLMRRKLRRTFARKLREGNDDHQTVSGGVDAKVIGQKNYKRWRAAQDTIADMREELVRSKSPRCKFPTIDLKKQDLTADYFNEHFLKRRTPIVAENAVTPRTWSWLAKQKCLGMAIQV
jgi:hypothetical protein